MWDIILLVAVMLILMLGNFLLQKIGTKTGHGIGYANQKKWGMEEQEGEYHE